MLFPLYLYVKNKYFQCQIILKIASILYMKRLQVQLVYSDMRMSLKCKRRNIKKKFHSPVKKIEHIKI